jgi:hypothetical protein
MSRHASLIQRLTTSVLEKLTYRSLCREEQDQPVVHQLLSSRTSFFGIPQRSDVVMSMGTASVARAGLAAVVLLCLVGSATAKPLNFQHFFPNFDEALRQILRRNCSEVFGHYMDEWSPICEDQNRQLPSCRASRVIDCLTDEMKESWKVNSE